MSLSAGLCILSCFVSTLWAAEVPPQPTASPTPAPAPKIARMEMRDGAAHFIFSDGRAAAVYYALGKKTTLPMKMRQIENTCLPLQRPARCEFMAELIPFEVSLRWTVNPHNEKLNALVKLTTSGRTTDFISNVIPLLRYGQTHEFLNLFGPETLHCDNWEWFEQLPHENDIYTLASWTSEAMAMTPETGVSENQGTSALYGMKFQKQGPRAVLLDYGTVPRSPFVPAPYVSNQMINLQYETGDGRPCQVGFEADSTVVINYAQSQEGKAVDLTKQQLLRQRVESLSLSGMSSLLQILTRNESRDGLVVE